jgi:cation diffusion facilitator family transporter
VNIQNDINPNVKTQAARLSIVSNTALIVLKLVIGIMTGSVSVLSEAIHSGVDLIASFIAFFAVRASEAPADLEHPFGHGKYENVSGAAEGFLIVVAGALIGFEAVRKLILGRPPERVGLALGVMAASTLVNFYVSRYLLKVARETDSDALMADAYHLRADVFTSLGVLLGLSLYAITRNPIFDPLAAMAVAALILHMGWSTTLGSIQQLIDVSLPISEIDRIEALAREHPLIRGFHQIRTRRVGGQRQIDLHIQVPGDLTVREGHAISHQLRDRIEKEMDGAHVVIHIEPWNGQDSPLEKGKLH